MSTSGHRSAPFGQTTVPFSTRALANDSGFSRISAKTGPTRNSDTSRSMIEPSVSVSRRRWSPIGLASVIRNRPMVELLQWCDLSQDLSLSSSLPVFAKFVTMQNCPLDDERQCSSGKGTSERRECVDLDQRFIFSISRVKMRWFVVAVEHPNHDTEESAQLGHDLERASLDMTNPPYRTAHFSARTEKPRSL